MIKPDGKLARHLTAVAKRILGETVPTGKPKTPKVPKANGKPTVVKQKANIVKPKTSTRNISVNTSGLERRNVRSRSESTNTSNFEKYLADLEATEKKLRGMTKDEETETVASSSTSTEAENILTPIVPVQVKKDRKKISVFDFDSSKDSDKEASCMEWKRTKRESLEQYKGEKSETQTWNPMLHFNPKAHPKTIRALGDTARDWDRRCKRYDYEPGEYVVKGDKTQEDIQYGIRMFKESLKASVKHKTGQIWNPKTGTWIQKEGKTAKALMKEYTYTLDDAQKDI
jgi:hypothetical protein